MSVRRDVAGVPGGMSVRRDVAGVLGEASVRRDVAGILDGVSVRHDGVGGGAHQVVRRSPRAVPSASARAFPSTVRGEATERAAAADVMTLQAGAAGADMACATEGGLLPM
jgi:hypothetical protein